MIVIVPAAAPSAAPVTGASTVAMPRSAAVSSRRTAVSTPTVERFTRTAPGAIRSSSPPDPRHSPSTSAGPGSESRTTSSVTSSAATVAPASTRAATRSASMSATASGMPAARRFRAIPEPIWPSPTSRTRVMRAEYRVAVEATAGTMSAMSIPWTPGLGLRCSTCDWSGPPDLHPAGCPACGYPLDTTYPADARWRIALPATSLTDLGRTVTPLVTVPGDPATVLKLESRNPTGSHKDRFHMIAAAVARAAGAPGVFTTSTGNHGVSCAAHAAREGLRCVVMTTGAVPQPLAVQLSAQGAVIGRLDAAGRQVAAGRLAARGWFAATSSDPLLSGASTPFGTDGYRLVVDEIVDQLGRLPDVVSVPCGSGDTLVGLRRGLDDAAVRAGTGPVTLLACEPAGSDALARSVAAGRPVDVADPHSIARSTVDNSVGRQAIAAASRDGATVVVADDAIAAETRALARTGLYLETSSALALAGIRQARREGVIGADALAVAVLTANGRGWSENEPGLFDVAFADDVDELLRAIST